MSPRATRLFFAFAPSLLLAVGGCTRASGLASSSGVAEVSLVPTFSLQTSSDETPQTTQKTRAPSGAPVKLECSTARAIARQASGKLAMAPPLMTPPVAQEFARSLADALTEFLDPHGLWAAQTDAPVASLLREKATLLLEAMEGKAQCSEVLKPFVTALSKHTNELRSIFDAAMREAQAKNIVDKGAVTEGVFERGTVTRPSKQLARILGERMGEAVAKTPALQKVADEARSRWFPEFSLDEWSRLLTAATLRAYVSTLDPHGGWAPALESVSLYDRSLEASPPARLWAVGTRTTVGVRIDSGPSEPLLEEDVIVSIDGVNLSGLSAESIEQWAESLDDEDAHPRVLKVLRKNELLTLHVKPSKVEEEKTDDAVTEVAYGGGKVLVVRLTDVPDALGADVSKAIALARGAGSKGHDREEIQGILLDLRGNGGGSIEGATTLLGLFLPGVPLFPMKHRDGAIETERAAEPPLADQWQGPVAALVDGSTASAAEMIAGSLRAYRRGQVFGANTFGKGCAQEYFDDVAGAGMLRLSTLLFSLPDGTPVQRVGVRPDVLLPLNPKKTSPLESVSNEREADLERALPTWSGPDVRDIRRLGGASWPSVKSVGPCDDDVVCHVLRTLSTSKNRDIAKRQSGLPR